MPVALSSPEAGLACLIFSMGCMGSWPALMKWCTLSRRSSSHIFLDYATGNFMMIALSSMTLGQFGNTRDDPSFFSQLNQLNKTWPSVLFAICGGALLMAGNLSLQVALELGVSMGVVLPLQSALCVILSTTVNYSLQPEKTDLGLLLAALFFFLAAIVLSICAEVQYKSDLEKKTLVNLQGMEDHLCSSQGTQDPSTTGGQILNLTAHPQGKVRRIVVGIGVSFLGGFCFGFFSPAFNIAVNDQFHWVAKDVPKLTVWTANFFFGLSFFMFAYLANISRLSAASDASLASNLACYCADSKQRGLAALSGMICAVANTAQFLGGSAAGFAACDLVQAFPLVGIVWGVVLFGEFQDAGSRVKAFLGALYVAYIVAVALLMLSVKE
ncbi:unnamed protein product [Polarella glacialis]|uniref:Uncharacterized protein n=1 Tax=Polarella glacialis TaxID=89957 RepID=A0A813GV31_POLGL|nr:unnamed protein product [Polarella glacialis]CAE8629556.1 unnamed protein product [Polarella glacialis]